MMLRAALITSLLFVSAPALAGAWLQPEGKGLYIAQARYFTSTGFFDVDGQRQSQPRFTKYELQPYIEYGATDWLTLGGTAFLDRVSQSGQHNNGLADPEIFARSILWRENGELISIQPTVKFASVFRDGGTPRGGQRSTDAELAVLYGRNFTLFSPNDYLDTRVGYRLRSNGRSNEWRNDTAVGLNVTDSIQLIPAIRSIVATDLTEASAFSQNGDLDSTTFTAEIGGLYRLNDDEWVQAAFSTIITGIQTGDGIAFSIGYAQRF